MIENVSKCTDLFLENFKVALDSESKVRGQCNDLNRVMIKRGCPNKKISETQKCFSQKSTYSQRTSAFKEIIKEIHSDINNSVDVSALKDNLNLLKHLFRLGMFLRAYSRTFNLNIGRAVAYKKITEDLLGENHKLSIFLGSLIEDYEVTKKADEIRRL